MYMNKNLLVYGLMAVACSGTALAQSKINGAGLLMLDTYKNAPASRSGVADVTVTAIVTLAADADASVLKANGCEISSQVADMVVVKAPLSVLETLANLDEVKAIDFGNQATPYLDVARSLTNVDIVHEGSDDALSGHAFTGKGVSVGLYDTGLDPNHAAFYDAATGKSRVKAIYLERSNGAGSEITNADDIATFTTDDQTETHGTHVLGIIAGSKGVEGKYAVTGKSGAQTGSIPYYGAAPEADIVVGCGDFYNECILDGIAKVVNKGTELGQPAVINLSLGSNSGSHDPSSTTGKFLDELGKKAIICISAGNEGDENMAVKQAFSARRNYLKTVVSGNTSASATLSYTVEFWSDDATVFDFDIVLYDKLEQGITDKFTVNNLNNRTASWSASESSAMAEQYTSSTSFRVTSGIDSATGRYYVYVQAYVQPKGATSAVLGYNIVGTSGHTVYGYVNTLSNSQDDAVFASENITGYTNGTPDGSINGFGCGYNMISVGAYVSRTSAPYIGGSSYMGSGRVGEIASFSSYGQTGDGRQLPHVCAPGAQIVSSISTYYTRNLSSFSADRTNAVSSLYNRDSYYYPMQGTSMSSPFVAGVVALWLEAWPDMTVSQCHDIIDATSKFETTMESKRWGAGKIDALAGLKMAIQNSASLNNVQADITDKNLVIENLGGRQYEISLVNTSKITVNVYNTQGGLVLSNSANADSVTIDASQLVDGIYVVAVSTPDGQVSRKLAIH